MLPTGSGCTTLVRRLLLHIYLLLELLLILWGRSRSNLKSGSLSSLKSLRIGSSHVTGLYQQMKVKIKFLNADH